MMLEDGEIDEEDLKIDDYDRVSGSVGGGVEADEQSRSPKHRSSSKRTRGGRKRSKKTSSSSSSTCAPHQHEYSPSGVVVALDEEADEYSTDAQPSEDKDERLISGPVATAAAPPVTTGPVSLFDLFKNSSDNVLVNPVITEKENKPSSLHQPLMMADSVIGSTKRQQADLKRKVHSFEKKNN